MYVVTFYRDDPAPHYTTTLSLHDALPILLDLGDVLELGGQPGHAPQGLAVGQVQLLAVGLGGEGDGVHGDRKSTRLNSSHVAISYAVFCLNTKIIYIILYIEHD